MENIFVEFLPPWIETGIQPAFYDKESGTVLQQTARMYAKVNELVEAFDTLSKGTKETVDEYIEKFTELKDFVDDFFDNLDVQDEVDHKIDEMIEDGVFDTIINQEIFGELNEAVTQNTQDIDHLIAGKTIVRDSEYDTFSGACSDCLTKGYILYLTADQEIPATGIELPDIIGNGKTITIMNTDDSNISITVNNKVISNVNFVANTLYCTYAINTLNDGIVERCTFNGFYTPVRISGSNNSIVRDCVMKNCGKGVWIKNANNVLIDHIELINTLAEKTAIATALNNNINGEDGVLAETSTNIKVINSTFEYCVERTLYSSDSDYVTFSNNIMRNTDGVKFCGYTAIRKGFVCEGNSLYNGLSDAFCQLYECDTCEVNNNIATSETDSNYVGWFIRAGHNFTNISVKGNYVKRVRRCFLHYEDTFPETVLTNNFNFSNVNIDGNTGIRMMLLGDNLYGAIHYTQNDTDHTHSGGQVIIRNNTLYSNHSQGDSSFDDRSNTFLSGIILSNIDKLVMENNDIRGIKDTNLVLPAVTLTNCNNVTLNETYYYDKSVGNITFDDADIHDGNMKVIANGPDHMDVMDLYLSNRGIISGTFSVGIVNKSPYIGVPKSWDLNLESLNIDEISKIWSIGGTTYASGSRATTSNSSTANMLCFYDNTTNNVIRCRTVRNMDIKGTITIYPA